MAKKGLENFTDKVAKDLIKKQSIRDEQRKIREEYLENKYKEASDLTNDIEVYIESLNNIININPNVISIEEFIKRDIQDVPKELLVPYTKPIELSLRKPTLLEKVFGRKINIRMREGFFPFTEPGYEIDMECLVCGGKGCKVCNHNGWIEVMPGGVIHPNVLKSANLDPEEWTGFYINIGLDRLVMMRYGVDDVRLFHSADLRFLSQFK